ncbi:hypothetical protein ACFSKW_45970 [Nonomuraea mangrovi]|uniref:Uncharacterized protein n=1 Tax=Nonomuraea mangrovi TaxID=2316207 RepID=A0ABW4TCT9_9ACTN
MLALQIGLSYDSEFVRRHDDDQPWPHAHSEAQPSWPYEHLVGGQPVNWPETMEREEASA